MSKKRFLFVVAAVIAAAFAFAADPAEGFWKSVDESGKATAFWDIRVVDGKLMGSIVKIVDKPDDTIAEDVKPSYKGFPVAGPVNKMKVLGTPWIWGLSRKQSGEWSGGNIIDPEKGDMYNCKIRFRQADGKKYEKDVLEMRGEIGFGIGRSQYWQRATEAEFR